MNAIQHEVPLDLKPEIESVTVKGEGERQSDMRDYSKVVGKISAQINRNFCSTSQ